jgi:hypothetical protein
VNNDAERWIIDARLSQNGSDSFTLRTMSEARRAR